MSGQMLVLPDSIEAKVVTADGDPVPDVLVFIDTLLEGRYYYGDVMGLTDGDGVVRLTGDQLRKDFEHDRRTFPMDYRVKLADCDPALDVIVRGHPDFNELKSSIEWDSLVDLSLRPLYDRARNEEFRTSAKRLDLSGEPKRVAKAEIVVTPTSGD